MTKILIAGDFCPWHRVAKKIGTPEAERILSPFAEAIRAADYAVVNLECPITEDHAPKGIEKIGPVLHCRPGTVELLRQAGFTLVTLANNHFYDCGQPGVEATIDRCRATRLDTVGGGKTRTEADSTLVRKIKDVTVAFINVCESEFSIANGNHGGSAPLDPITVFHRLREAKQSADFVLVIAHGGHEQYPLPSERMQRTFRFFADAGADAVLNHHQHCFSGYEVYNGIPIFYGLGNFCFDWPGVHDPAWHEGYAVTLELGKDRPVGFTLQPYVQCLEEACVRPMNAKERAAFDCRIDRYNAIIASADELSKAFDRWASTQRPLWVFAPYDNRYLAALYARRLFPGFIGRKKKLRILNMLRCEAHRDLLTTHLENNL